MNLNPIAGIVEAVGGVIGDLHTSDKERMALELEGRRIDQAMDLAQVEVNKVEAAHASVFVAGWRPACGWAGVAAMVYQFLLYPLLVWLWALLQALGWLNPGVTPPPMLDTDALWVVLTGMLGIAGARTVEKIKGVAR